MATISLSKHFWLQKLLSVTRHFSLCFTSQKIKSKWLLLFSDQIATRRDFSHVLFLILLGIFRYAVYIPLFLPVMIPVLMSLRGIRSWWFSGSEEAAEAKKKTE